MPFKADLYAADLAAASLHRLGEIVRTAGDIIVEASDHPHLLAEANMPEQMELIAAEIRRRTDPPGDRLRDDQDALEGGA